MARKITLCALASMLASACGDSALPPTSEGSHKPAKQHDDNDDEGDGDGDGDRDDGSDDEGDDEAQLDASTGSDGEGSDAGTEDPGTPLDPAFANGLPAGAEKIAGIEFFQRVVGKWSGINSDTPVGFDFPMTVDIAVDPSGMLFGMFDVGNLLPGGKNNVLWGFNIETYGGKDVLTYRNGGYLLGLKRDSRTTLKEYDTAKGFYRFCAVLETGVPVKDGCNYLDATYTFTGKDKMLFEVKTHSGEIHVHWEATRQQTHTLPNPFPATIKSQGNGSAKWPAVAGIQ